MTVTKTAAATIEKKIAVYNMVPNIFWSIVCLWPIFVFSYNYVPMECLSFFLVTAFAPLFMSRRLIDMLQWSANTADYRKVGVSFVNHFVQDGTTMKRIVKKKFPGHRQDWKSSASLAKMISRTYLFEKFHWGMFVFFTLTAIYAFLNEFVLWGVFLVMLNLIFNVYPNLLQQYVRIKLRRIQALNALNDAQNVTRAAADFGSG